MQISLPQFLTFLLQPITQPLIFAIANLILEIPSPPLPKIYPRIPLLYEAMYFFKRDLLADVRNHVVNNRFAMTINGLKPLKVYLIYDWETKYRNQYNLTKGTRRRTMGSQLIDYPFRYLEKLKNEIWKLTVSKPFHNHEHSIDNIVHLSLHWLNKHHKEQIAS